MWVGERDDARAKNAKLPFRGKTVGRTLTWVWSKTIWGFESILCCVLCIPCKALILFDLIILLEDVDNDNSGRKINESPKMLLLY